MMDPFYPYRFEDSVPDVVPVKYRFYDHTLYFNPRKKTLHSTSQDALLSLGPGDMSPPQYLRKVLNQTKSRSINWKILLRVDADRSIERVALSKWLHSHKVGEQRAVSHRDVLREETAAQAEPALPHTEPPIPHAKTSEPTTVERLLSLGIPAESSIYKYVDVLAGTPEALRTMDPSELRAVINAAVPALTIQQKIAILGI